VSTDDDQEIERIAHDVQAYLQNHPHAADTLEGVVKWWLTRQRYDQAEAQVSRALELLEQRGLIARATTTDGRPVFSSADTAGKNPRNN